MFKNSQFRPEANSVDLVSFIEYWTKTANLGIGRDEAKEIFSEIVHLVPGSKTINYEQFGEYLYSNRNKDIHVHILKIHSFIVLRGTDFDTFFIGKGHGDLTFAEFSTKMRQVDPLIKFNEIDLIFFYLDKNRSGTISIDELGELVDVNNNIDLFKNYCTKYIAEKNKNSVDELLDEMITGGDMAINKVEFTTFSRRISKCNFCLK